MITMRSLLRLPAGLSVLVGLLSAGVHAQWLNYPPPGTPLTRDGRPNLNAPAPRALDGKPDLTGVWFHEITTPAEMRRLYGAVIDEAIKVGVPGMEIGTQHKYSRNILLDYAEESLMKPLAAEQLRRTIEQRDPSDVCGGVLGFPRAGLLSEPIKLVQAPNLTIVLYEAGNLHRQIFTDGRALPKEVAFPAFLGYSVGRWDHDTFVVETAGFNGKTPLDGMGHPHGEALRVTERFHRRDFGHLDVEMTFEDPEMYTKPFTVHIPHDLVADNDIFEMFCENEKDRAHLKGR
jgi:hypothetical protein